MTRAASSGADTWKTSKVDAKQALVDRAVNDALASTLVVENVPVIPESKHAKLVNVIQKIFSPLGVIKYLEIPPTGGYGIVEYATAEEAERARKQTDGFQLDKAHRFQVSLLSDVERLRQLPPDASFEPPAELLAELSDETARHMETRPNLLSHLADPRGRDQFVVCTGVDTAVYWVDPLLPPELEHERANWTESDVAWSPQGLYLATFHRQGIALWGGSEFQKIVRFEHPQPRLIHFSGNERYLVTFNAPDSPEPLVVWETGTGRRLKVFESPLRLPPRLLERLWSDVLEERARADAANPMLASMQSAEWKRMETERERGMPPPDIGRFPWPLVQFSADETMMARLGEDCIHVFEMLPDRIELLDHRPVSVPAALGFAWSPTTPNLLAIWTPEEGQSPARVLLLEMPSRRELRQKALYSVANIELIWHPQGKYLACRVERYTRSRKGRFTNFEIFRVNEKDVPVETLEFSERDKVLAFAWEPKSDRFAILHQQQLPPNTAAAAAAAATTTTPLGGLGTAAGGVAGAMGLASGSTRPMVTFYEVQKDTVRTLFRLERKQCNRICWSPTGMGHVLLAGLGTMGGVLEWWNVADHELMGVDEHFACSDICWDPSGRFVCTWVNASASRIEHGYQLWTFYGRKLGAPHFMENLFEFSWRPRPAKWFLSEQEEREVRKNLKQYRAKYEAEDTAMRAHRRRDIRVARRDALAEWQKLVERNRARYRAEAEKRAALWKHIPGGERHITDALAADAEGTAPGDDEVLEEWVEQVLEVEEKVLEKYLDENDERD